MKHRGIVITLRGREMGVHSGRRWLSTMESAVFILLLAKFNSCSRAAHLGARRNILR
jgi:hypothetical protein